MFSALFSQVIGYLDLLKPSTLEKLGSYGDWVSWIGQALAAGLAVLMLAVGRWAPPVPAMPSSRAFSPFPAMAIRQFASLGFGSNSKRDMC